MAFATANLLKKKRLPGLVLRKCLLTRGLDSCKKTKT